MLKAILALIGVLAAAFAGAGYYAYRNPLTLFEWMGRQQLKRAGLAPVQVASPGGPLTVYEGGTAGDAAPTLLLLHGAGDQAGNWGAVADRLAARHRLVVPDLPGHGESAPSSGPLEIGTIFAGVEAVLLREPEGRRVTIVGNSLGAWMATLLAEKHPARVERIVLVNGGALIGHSKGPSLMPKDRAEARAVIEALTDPASPRVPDNVLDDIARRAQSGPIARIFAGAATSLPYTRDGRLGAIETPVEVLWGVSDRVMDLDYAQRLVEGFPRARLTRIERCGHVPFRECPGRFLEALDGALAQPPAAARATAAPAAPDAPVAPAEPVAPTAPAEVAR